MEDVIPAFVAELLALVGYAVLATVLAGLGLASELNGLSTYGTGEVAMAAWFAFMGGVALVAGALLVRDELLPRLRAATADRR